MSELYRCAYGWALYLEWCALCDAQAPVSERTVAWDRYMAHVDECEGCFVEVEGWK